MQKNLFTIGIVTDKMQYIEHEFIFMKRSMTKAIAGRLNKIFSAYQFDKYTEICFVDETMLDSSLSIYLKTIAGIYGIEIENIHDATIMLRLVKLHTNLVGRKWKDKYLEQKKIDQSKKLTSTNLQQSAILTLFRKLWNAFLRKDVCPWINADVDLSIDLGSKSLKRQRKRVRLASYYLVCRRYFRLRNQRVQA